MTDILFKDGAIFENMDDGIIILKDDALLYQNQQSRKLWGQTRFFRLGDTPAFEGDLKEALEQRKFFQKTVEISAGSSIYYYYVYVFPINGEHVVLITRNITETYLDYQRNSEYKALFNGILELTFCPVAVISSCGIIDKMNNHFFNIVCSINKSGYYIGSFIWEHFGEDSSKIKELFEQLIDGKISFFNTNNFHFRVCVAGNGAKWALVQYMGVISCIHKPRTEEIAADPPLESVVSDVRATIRVMRWLGNLPWGVILALVAGGLSLFGGNFLGFIRSPAPNPPVEQGK